MSKNHRNRSWRAKWVIDKATGFARHKTGVVGAVIDGKIRVDGTHYKSTLPYVEDFFVMQLEMIFGEHAKELGLDENYDDEPDNAPQM